MMTPELASSIRKTSRAMWFTHHCRGRHSAARSRLEALVTKKGRRLRRRAVPGCGLIAPKTANVARIAILANGKAMQRARGSIRGKKSPQCERCRATSSRLLYRCVSASSPRLTTTPRTTDASAPTHDNAESDRGRRSRPSSRPSVAAPAAARTCPAPRRI